MKAMKTQRTRATIARGTLEAGRGVPPCSPARFRPLPSTLALLAGLIAGCGVLAAGAPQLAGAAVLAAGLIGGLALRWWEEQPRAPGRRCRVCGAHEALDLRMWAARDLCVSCSERRCRVCGCTDERACMELGLLGDCEPCHWVEPDLCSTCAVDIDDPSIGELRGWDFRECQQCGGAGALLVCVDDLCHAQGWCMHGDGMETCPECRGTGTA